MQDLSHCRKQHCRNGVVDTFGHCLFQGKMLYTYKVFTWYRTVVIQQWTHFAYLALQDARQDFANSVHCEAITYAIRQKRHFFVCMWIPMFSSIVGDSQVSVIQTWRQCTKCNILVNPRWSTFTLNKLQLTVGSRDLSQADLSAKLSQFTKWQLFSPMKILSENSCHFVN